MKIKIEETNSNVLPVDFTLESEAIPSVGQYLNLYEVLSEGVRADELGFWFEVKEIEWILAEDKSLIPLLKVHRNMDR